MIIRPARAEDLPTLLEFEQKIIDVERPMDVTIKTNEAISYYDIAAYIEADDTEVVVAVDRGEIVGSGYGQIRPRKDFFKQTHLGYIGFMYVKPTHRGQGVSQLLLGVLCDWFEIHDIEEVRLTVYEKNPRAIRAYEKSGFKKHLIEMRLNLGEDS
ncbi:GNAT family N-acetyltransferase [Marinicella sp. W31]|uniref:GNAT family N-acetyltransferase n=1 Tax=Marinicella sp. W31 TaxID=3023713 RepID=UPI003757E157